MIKIRLVLDDDNAGWNCLTRTLSVPIPTSKRVLRTALHEIGHCWKNHKMSYPPRIITKERLRQEIEAWRVVEKVLSFFHAWTVADKQHMQYCLAGYKIYYKFFVNPGIGIVRREMMMRKLDRYHPGSPVRQK